MSSFWKLWAFSKSSSFVKEVNCLESWKELDVKVLHHLVSSVAYSLCAVLLNSLINSKNSLKFQEYFLSGKSLWNQLEFSLTKSSSFLYFVMYSKCLLKWSSFWGISNVIFKRQLIVNVLMGGLRWKNTFCNLSKIHSFVWWWLRQHVNTVFFSFLG